MVWKRQQNAYGKTPVATTPYQKAAQVWDERIGSARVQAKNWRLATLASLGVSAVLAGGMLWQATQSLVTPYVVEIDTTGEVRGVTPTVQDYVPSDAQIAFQLRTSFERHGAFHLTPLLFVKTGWTPMTLRRAARPSRCQIMRRQIIPLPKSVWGLSRLLLRALFVHRIPHLKFVGERQNFGQA